MATRVKGALTLTAAALIGAVISACATEPAIERTRTTLGEVDLTGLECRDESVMGSLRKRTICASPEQWAAYDEQQRQNVEDIQRDMTGRGLSIFGR